MRDLWSIPFTISILAAAACTTRDDESRSGEAEVAAASALSPGAYELEAGPRAGTLTIESVDGPNVTFSISVVNSFGGHNMGELSHARAVVDAVPRWVHVDPANDCRIALSVIATDVLSVDQEGRCGFGLGVIANGRYQKQPPNIEGEHETCGGIVGAGCRPGLVCKPIPGNPGERGSCERP